MDFKSFANEYKPQQDKSSEQKSDQTTGEYEKIISQYEGMSQEQLMSELKSQTEKMKKEGKWNDSEMYKISSTLSPYLNEQQKQMLGQLMQTLKNE